MQAMSHGSENEPRPRWLAGGSIVTLCGGLAGRTLQLGCQVALARLLGPATYGLYAIG